MEHIHTAQNNLVLLSILQISKETVCEVQLILWFRMSMFQTEEYFYLKACLDSQHITSVRTVFSGPFMDRKRLTVFFRRPSVKIQCCVSRERSAGLRKTFAGKEQSLPSVVRTEPRTRFRTWTNTFGWGEKNDFKPRQEKTWRHLLAQSFSVLDNWFTAKLHI